MDKSWTKLRNRLCKEYSDGVRSFISLAKEHVDHRGFTRCPCKNCQNVIMKPPCEVEGDLYKYGMSFTYDRWTCHGETPDLSLYPKPKETVEKHKELATTSQNIDTENEKMVAQKGAQTDSSTPMTDDEIMADVLGKKKAYVKGMGYGAKPPHSHRKSTYSQEYVQSLETQLADVKEQLTAECSSMQATIQSQREEMEMRDHEYERRFRQMNDILERFTAANPPLSKD